MRTENSPVGVMEIHMVLPADVFASAHVVVQIFQFVLAVNVVGQDGFF